MNQRERTTLLEIQSLINELLTLDVEPPADLNFSHHSLDTLKLAVGPIEEQPPLVLPKELYSASSDKTYPSDLKNVLPTDEEMKGYRARLFKYNTEVFPKNWHNVLKQYVAKMFPGKTSSTMTVREWDTLFDEWDGRIQLAGQEKLIEFIEGVVK